MDSRLRVVPDDNDEYDYEYAVSPAAALDDTQYLRGGEEETQDDVEAFANAAFDDSTTLEPSSSSSYQEEEDGITLCVTGPNSHELHRFVLLAS